VPADRVAELVATQAIAAGLEIPSEVVECAAIYLRLLARWNRKINLTGLDVDPPDDQAVDRLVIEPLAAAKYFPTGDAAIVDIGSGGGSPAVPIKLALASIQLVMIESTGRKATFLREVIRELRLTNTIVENCRIDEFAGRPANHATADAVTLRAVRVDEALMRNVRQLLRPGGQFVRFGTREELARTGSDRLFELIPSRNAYLSVAAP
jgi:16S rRNA (guanine527-N7)-methyltransferase